MSLNFIYFFQNIMIFIKVDSTIVFANIQINKNLKNLLHARDLKKQFIN